MVSFFSCPPNPFLRLDWVHLKVRGKIQKMKCEKLSNGDKKVFPIDPPSMVWLGVNNIAESIKDGKATNIKVSYLVLPKGAYYRGGTYGRYGGFDLVLGKLSEPAPAKFAPACLPKPSYIDTGKKGSIAGFGMYSRPKCVTDSYGPMKSHFCSTLADFKGKSYRK